MTHEEAMARAITLAQRGWGRVAPNPMVGCMLLRDGVCIAEGHHAEFGGAHAEAAALAACESAGGTTCVVTLEPCAHHGKTPPCADALVAAGVERVVIAGRDPNPTSRGGIERLRGAGIAVEVGVGREEAAAMNAGYLWATVRPDRPFVAVKLATSLDGFIADAEGRSQWISGPEARDYVQWLRAGFDALGVGRRTAECDDPALTVRGPLVPRTPPRRVVFARSGRLSPGLRLFGTERDAATTVIIEPRAEALAAPLRDQGVDVRQATGLGDAVRSLRALGIGTLLVDGGGALAAAMLDEGVVDRLYWIQAPRWLGRGVAAFGPRDPIALDASSPWTVVERRTLGPDTLLVVDREPCLPES